MIGQTLSHYRITAKLGEGGMGEVYRAEDTRLGREVALKVLPGAVAENPERLSRFEREAHALATLDHPNIVQIYSVEDVGGVHFLTMQLVRGRSLAELIPEEGFALGQFLDIAIPLVDGLRGAHAKGIAHRDLKPENVMIDDEGRVKILDFGLAKLRAVDVGEHMSELPTATMTQQGVVMGTIPYMSPEQVQGQPIDRRTDIFSVGVILYEMTVGRRPFAGQSDAALVSSILRDTPKSVTSIRAELPRVLDVVIARCLEKDPQQRFQSAEDLLGVLIDLQRATSDPAVDLEALSERLAGEARLGRDAGPEGKMTLERAATPAGVAPRSAKSGRPWVWRVVMGAVIVILGIGFVWLLRGPGGRTGDQSLRGSYTRMTSMPGAEQYPSVAPDGRWVVYAGEGSGNYDLYLQRIGGRTPINLTESSPSDEGQPAYSPDGELIAFRSEREGGGLFVMGPTGEGTRRVTDFGFNPAWSPDGARLAFSTEPVSVNPLNWDAAGELWAVDVTSGETTRLFQGDAVQPAWSPNGERIAYTARFREPVQMDIWTVAADGTDPRPLTRDAATDWSPAWSSDGEWIYFASDRGGSMNLWRVAVDPSSGEARREPEPITTPSTFLAHPRLSGDGRTIAYASILMTQNIQRLALDPETGVIRGEPDWVTSGSILFSSPDPSPSGDRVAFYSRVQPEGDLYVASTDGTDLRQLTSDESWDRVPRWSPDGQWVAFFSNQGGQLDVWKIRPDGSGRQRLTQGGGSALMTWSPDSRRMAVFQFEEARSYIFDPGRPWSEQEPLYLPPMGEDSESFLVTTWAPGGDALAGQIGRGAGIVTYSLKTGIYDQLTDFGEWPVWLPDGEHLLFVSEGKYLHVVDRATKQIERILAVGRDVIGPPRISADGRNIYLSRRVTEGDVWLLTLE